MEKHADFDNRDSDEAFAELLGKAEPRPLPPAEDEAIVRDAVQAEWRDVAGRHVRRRRIATFALAASVLLAVIATSSLVTDPAGDAANGQMAAVEKRFGETSIASGKIFEGDVVETGVASGLALAWHDGGSLRIDELTSVVFEADHRIYLREGRVYFDSVTGPLTSTRNTGAARLSIRTDHGLVRHLGTQYMTRVRADALVVSVREGVVSIDGGVPVRASAGQEFSISASGELSISNTNGVDEWEWVEKSSPPVDLQDRLISDALDWVSRESGRAIRYSSEEARRVANRERLRGMGGMNELPPSRALELFMMTVGLNARIEGEEIVISDD